MEVPMRQDTWNKGANEGNIPAKQKNEVSWI
jgi:hypothetical protein